MKRIIILSLFVALVVPSVHADVIEASQIGSSILVSTDLPASPVGRCENGNERGVVTEYPVSGSQAKYFGYSCELTLAPIEYLKTTFPTFFRLFSFHFGARYDLLKFETNFVSERVGNFAESFVSLLRKTTAGSIILELTGGCYSDIAASCSRDGILKKAEAITIRVNRADSLISIPAVTVR